MPFISGKTRLLGFALLAAAASLAAPSSAADRSARSDAQARYQQERAACNSGQSAEDRATCLREAGAALEAARKGRLAHASENYDQNALARCQPLPDEYRQACERRMRGEGKTEGSVAEGGIYRELTTIEPAAQSGSSMNDSAGGASSASDMQSGNR